MSDSLGPFDDLRDYLACLRDGGSLRDIEGADWDLEIGAITETTAFSRDPVALLFDDVPGHDVGFRVASNLYNTEARQALALGLPPDRDGIDLVRAWRSRDLTPLEPVAVDDGPVRENVHEGDDVDLTRFPSPRWHEHDGGRFFGTGDTVLIADPEGGWTNASVYRCQVHDERTLGLAVAKTHHGWELVKRHWERGDHAPIAVLGGQSPAVYAGACLPADRGRSELALAGALVGHPIEVVVDPGSGLGIPANAEVAVIGRVPPPDEETRVEGPFGECTGYYAGGEEPRPVIHVDRVWHRDDPILHGAPPMHGSVTKHALGGRIATGAEVWDAIDDEVPNVTGVYPVYQQCQAGADVLCVSIEQQYAGHASQAAMAALGAQAAVTTIRAVVVVDDDIDPADPREVVFALTTRCDPSRDVDVVTGIPDWYLDPRVAAARKRAGDVTKSAMAVNACKPYSRRDDYPRRNVVDEATRERVAAEWDIPY